MAKFHIAMAKFHDSAGNGVWVERSECLKCVARYLFFVCAASLVWESLHMPLYTLWRSGTPSALIEDVLWCSMANLIIALSALLVALALARARSWPTEKFSLVLLLAVVLSVAYTAFSEWLNVDVLHAWAYSDLMPVIPGIGVGLSPLLQWIFIPLVGLWWAGHSQAT